MVLEWLPTWKVAYGHIEETAGLLCPLLSILSLIYQAGYLEWSALLFLWLGCGHTVLYFYDLYPQLRYRPFFKGLFAFGVGLCWPLWYAHQSTRPRGT
jgi:hypothetical protein